MSTAQEQDDFSFPVSSSSIFIESPRLEWRCVPPTAKSTPLTRLELLRSKYLRRSFSYMENDSAQMMTMMMRTNDHDHHTDESEGHDFNKMDLLWEDLPELPRTRKYYVDDANDSSDLDQVGTDKRRASSHPVRRPNGKVAILKVLKKLFYVRKIGSSRSV